MALPNYQSDDQPFQLMQSTWKSQLDPVLAIPFISGRQVMNVTISSGSPAVINHRLARMQQGFFFTDINAPAKIARIAPFNDKTLTLSSDATVTVAVWVY